MSLCFQCCPLGPWSSCLCCPLGPWSLLFNDLPSTLQNSFTPSLCRFSSQKRLVQLSCHPPSLLDFSEEVGRFPWGWSETSGLQHSQEHLTWPEGKTFSLLPVLLSEFYKVRWHWHQNNNRLRKGLLALGISFFRPSYAPSECHFPFFLLSTACHQEIS